MHICQFETPSFSFIAAGETPNHAWDVMVVAWQRHCDKTGAEIDYMDRDGCREFELYAGEAFRDSEIIVVNGH